MRKSAHFTSRRIAPAYIALRNISYTLWKEAESSPKGRTLKIVASMVFSAFCLEAYMNHLGQRIDSTWQENERDLRPEEKLDRIRELLKIEIDSSVRPFHTFGKIFWFRRHIAHGRTEILAEEGTIVWDEDTLPPEPRTEWEKAATRKTCLLFLDDSKKMIIWLHASAGLGDQPFLEDTWETITTHLPSSASE